MFSDLVSGSGARLCSVVVGSVKGPEQIQDGFGPDQVDLRSDSLSVLQLRSAEFCLSFSLFEERRCEESPRRRDKYDAMFTVYFLSRSRQTEQKRLYLITQSSQLFL